MLLAAIASLVVPCLQAATGASAGPPGSGTNAATAGRAVARAKTGQKWVDMDYGPFLTASIEAPEPATNIAYKGIAIRLAEAFGGEQNEAVVFDTDLLRYSVGWTGKFVALKGTVYDGEHWAYPRINGEQVFGNPNTPGWAKRGSFKDPRPFIYGPLPRNWAHWRGLYLHGQKVILAYTVGHAQALEMPGLEKGAGVTAFSRVINLSPSDAGLGLQVAFDSAKAGKVVLRDGLTAATAATEASEAIAFLAGPDLAQLLTGARSGPRPEPGLLARWDFDDDQGGPTADGSGNGRRLKLVNPLWSSGRKGGSLELTSDGYAELERSDDIDFLAGDLTFAAWVNTKRDGTIFSQAAPEGPWGPDAKALFIRDGKLVFEVGGVGALESARRVFEPPSRAAATAEAARRDPMGQPRYSPPPPWQHVALVWSHQQGVAAIYLNGRREASAALKPKTAVRGQVVRFGYTSADFPPTSFFRGRLDEVRVYRRALREAEVRALAGAPPKPGVLAAGVVGAGRGARWIATEDGHLRLDLPACATPSRLMVLLAHVGDDGLPRFGQLLKQAGPAPDLKPFIQGGPPRWPQTITTRGQAGTNDGPYVVDAITWPDDNPWDSWMRFSGFDFFKDATRAAICTWSGDVWIVAGLDDKLERLAWRRFATGLYQPLGVKIVDEQIYIVARDQITRLHDSNGDGEADFYENFNNDTQNTEHFHEFAMDLQTDAAGDFYYMKGGRHGRDALHPQHGVLMKVSKDGARSEIIAKGFRAPNGLEITPQGEFYTTDQEGFWMPANRLNLIKPGKFYGNVWSWFPEGKPTSYEPPICWIHPRVDRSPSTMAWVTSSRWGPLKDRLLSLSYGVGKIFLVLYETVDGVVQGGIVPLPPEFDTGLIRSRFSPRDGQFYTCGLYGWAANKTQAGGFYRVRYTGQPLRLPCGLNVATNGVVLKFSVPLDPSAATDPRNYSVEIWNYRWTDNYGSPDFKLDGEKGRDRLTVESAQLSRDGQTVFLKLPGICPVMQMHIQMNLKAADGAPIETFVHNTIHKLGNRSGELLLGEPVLAVAGQTQPRLKNESSGLVQRLVSTADPAKAAVDTRTSRLVALHVPAGAPPSPFLPAGPFTATWTGFIKLDLSGSYSFRAEGEGRITVLVNGQPAIPASDLAASPASSRALPLSGGLNSLEVKYESPPTGVAACRLFWSNQRFPTEPAPPTVLVHEGDEPALRKGGALRLGRSLFATRHCAKCHAVAEPLDKAMPELAADTPALDGAGSKFQASWMARWLHQPAAMVSQATMPACLRGSTNEVESQAQDLAAYLDSLRESPAVQGATTNAAPPASLIKAGEAVYARLGCVACHLLPGDEKIEDDTRRTQDYVRAKWQPRALVDFLRAPARQYAWTLMPDFQLSAAEAEALAAYVISRGEPAPISSSSSHPSLSPSGSANPSASPQRGRELVVALGCVNCHTITGVAKTNLAAGCDRLAGTNGTTGCLASTPARRGQAPDFGFAEEERQALSSLLQEATASLRRDSWAEFASRQIAALRCTACHQLENAKDFWSALEARLPQRQPGQVNPYDSDETEDRTIHRTRPPLIFAGEKLRPEWTEQFLLGRLSYKPRLKLEARMPAFPAYALGLAQGMALDHGLEAPAPRLPPVDPELAQAGRALIQKGAFACVDCHAVGAQPALAGADTVTINFVYVPARLRKEYFDRYLQDPVRLLPGTMMPKFVNDQGLTGITAYYGGEGRRQFEAIWHFMRTVPASINTVEERGK